MATFPRTLLPAQVSPPKVPGGLVSIGHTGGVQLRSNVRMGRVWEERWAVFKADNIDAATLMAFIEKHYNEALTFNILHLLLPGSGKAPNGAGGGTPLVNGAGQSGTTINTDGWTPSITNVVRAGDVVQLGSLPQLFRVQADVNSNGSGQAALTINPPILAGAGPDDNNTVWRTSCLLTAIIVDYDIPGAGPDEYVGGMRVAFREAP